MPEKVGLVTRVYALPGVTKGRIEGLKQGLDADVDVKSLGRGRFEFSGPSDDVKMLHGEAMYHCPAQNRSA